MSIPIYLKSNPDPNKRPLFSFGSPQGPWSELSCGSVNVPGVTGWSINNNELAGTEPTISPVVEEVDDHALVLDLAKCMWRTSSAQEVYASLRAQGYKITKAAK